MYGLVKLAGIKEQSLKLQQAVRERAQQEPYMNPEQYESFLNGVKQRYGINTPVSQLEDDMLEHANYMSPQAAKKMGFSSGEDEGIIHAPRHKEITLHEMGHAQDPHLMRSDALAQGSKLLSELSFYGGAAVPMIHAKKDDENDQKGKQQDALLAGGAAATGGLAGLASGKIIERKEDRANNFVKKVLTDELGSPQKAEEAFKNSILPSARGSYSLLTKHKMKTGAITGLTGAGIGLAGASIIRHKRENQEKE